MSGGRQKTKFLIGLNGKDKTFGRDRDTRKANYERLWSEVKGFIHAISDANPGGKG